MTKTKTQSILLIPHGSISPSPFNPRKHFSREGIDKLKESFREHGFNAAISHLLVREIPDIDPSLPRMFELVCGERRWRAAGELIADGKLPSDLPAVVEEMSDAQALELQLIENLQREDLSPLEKASAFQQMIKALHQEGDKNPMETVALRLGYSAMNVGRYVRVLKLAGSLAGEALESGEISLKHALSLSRVPAGELRDTLTRRVLTPPDGFGPMPTRQLERIIASEYMSELRGADFDLKDPSLRPLEHDATSGERLAGGACTDCPFNSSNSPDSESKIPLCLNPECFREKKQRSHSRWMESVGGEGRSGLPLEEAERVFDYTGKKLSWNSGFVDLSDPPDDAELKSPMKKAPSWKKLVAGQGVPILLAKDTSGKVHELARRELARTAALENEAVKPEAERLFRKPSGTPSEKKVSAEEKEAAQIASQRRRNLLHRIDEETRKAFLEAARVERLPLAFWGIAFDLLDMLLGYSPDRPKEQDQLSLNSHFVRLLMDLTMDHVDEEVRWKPWCKVFDVDAKKIRKRIEEEVAASESAKAASKALGESLVWKSRKEKAEEFEWNDHQVCTTPDEAEFQFPKGFKTKVRVTVRVARGPLGWISGHDLEAPLGGNSSPVKIPFSTNYDSRNAAVRGALVAVIAALRSHNGGSDAALKIEAYLDSLACPPSKVTSSGKKAARSGSRGMIKA